MDNSDPIQQERQLRNLDALLEVSKAMGKEVDLDDLLKLILDRTTEVMNAERSSLFLHDENTNELWSKIAQGLNAQEIRFPVGVGIAGIVAESRKTRNIKDAYKDPFFNDSFDKRNNFRTKTVLCLPMIGRESKLVGVIQVLNKKNGYTFDEADEELLSALGANAALALQRAQLVQAYVENKRMEETLALAHSIQMSMLPNRFPPFPKKVNFIDLYATIEPAKDVGGDLYDFFMVDDKNLCLAIGDVSGKGVPAALFMAVTKTLLQAVTTSNMHPNEILRKMNDILSINNEADMFCTFFAAIVNIETGNMSFSNGGHNPPYILHNDGNLEPLKNPIGIALGVMDGLDFTPAETKLEEGEGLFLYTDGINEAMSGTFEEYDYKRMEAILKKEYQSTPKHLIDVMISDLKSFVGEAEQSDDITALAFRFLKKQEP